MARRIAFVCSSMESERAGVGRRVARCRHAGRTRAAFVHVHMLHARPRGYVSVNGVSLFCLHASISAELPPLTSVGCYPPRWAR